MTNSNSFLSTGDYVRTSKGNLGIIEVPEHFVIGYYDENIFIQVSRKYFPERWGDRDTFIEHFQKQYPYEILQIVPAPNRVLLGDKNFPIWSDRLTKLNTLKIRTQQGSSVHVTDLPIDDAKVIMSIYDRNKIWYSVS